MATTKKAEAKPEVKTKASETERVPSENELHLERLTEMGFILVQWIGSKSVMKMAPSPHQAVRQFGAPNYGLIAPKQYLMIHKKDFDKRFYRRPVAKEKPKKEDVQLSISGRFGHVIRVTW